MDRGVVRLASLLLLAFVYACRQDEPKPQTPPISPGSREVPLKVWVVLGVGGGGEPIGGRQNAGCRLTSIEMTQYITELQTNADFFTTGTTFPWDSQLNVVYWSDLFIVPPFAWNRYRNFEQFDEEVFAVQNKWTPNMLNVYFCGAVDANMDPDDDLYDTPSIGFCADPAAFIKPYIVINDGGSWSGPGFLSHWDDRVLKHEVTHFLGRFENETFAGYEIGGQEVSVTYDSEEHTPEEPVAWKLVNILYGGGEPFTLKIGPLEKAEMRSRIIQGTWLNP